MNSMWSTNNNHKSNRHSNFDMSQSDIPKTNKSEFIHNPFGGCSDKENTQVNKIIYMKWKNTNMFEKYLKKT